VPDDGKYIYCIADVGRQQTFGPLGIGGRGDQLTCIPYRDIAAVTSDSPVKRYRVNYENSAAHERAIEAVFAHHTVLPVRFGTLAEDDDDVRAMLELEYGEYRALLEGMRGKMEVGLKAVFDERLIYREIVASSPEISRRREAVAELPPDRAHWQLVEIGRMVEHALEIEKARVREEIVGALRGACCDFRLTDRLLGERMIMNAAFLVERAREAAFDREVDALAERYGQRIKFKYVTGFPPFNFVCLVVHWLGQRHAVA
jgi:hypothetical protein